MNTRNEELEKMLYEHITKDMTHKKFVKEVGKSSSSYMVSSRVILAAATSALSSVCLLSQRGLVVLYSCTIYRLQKGPRDSSFRSVWWI